MSAAHSRAQRNDFNVHLDSAGIGLAQRCRAAPGNAFWASAKSVRLLHGNEDEGPEVLYRPLI